MPSRRTWFSFTAERAHSLGVRAEDVRVICVGEFWQAVWVDGTVIGDVSERANPWEVTRWREELRALDA